MKKIKYILFFGLILSLFSTPAFAQKFDANSEEKNKKAVQEIILNAVQRLQLISNDRAFQLKDVNTSVEKTVEAAAYYFNEINSEESVELIEKARKLYSDNVIAHLLASELLEEQNNIEGANKARLDFLKRSATAPFMAREAFKYEEREFLLFYVSARLKSFGIEPPMAKGDIQVPLLQQLVTEKGTFLREFISTGLPLVFCLGLVFFLWRGMTDPDWLEGSWSRIVFRSYLFCILAYGLWIAHLFLKVPAFIQPAEKEVALVIAFGFLFNVLLELVIKYISWLKERSDPTNSVCLKCRKIIPKIDYICPFCGEAQED